MTTEDLIDESVREDCEMSDRAYLAELEGEQGDQPPALLRARYDDAYMYDKAMHWKDVLARDMQRRRHLYFILQQIDNERPDIQPELPENVPIAKRKRMPYTSRFIKLDFQDE